jgi:hypothetical protein
MATDGHRGPTAAGLSSPLFFPSPYMSVHECLRILSAPTLARIPILVHTLTKFLAAAIVGHHSSSPAVEYFYLSLPFSPSHTKTHSKL